MCPVKYKVLFYKGIYILEAFTFLISHVFLATLLMGRNFKNINIYKVSLIKDIIILFLKDFEN